MWKASLRTKVKKKKGKEKKPSVLNIQCCPVQRQNKYCGIESSCACLSSWLFLSWWGKFWGALLHIKCSNCKHKGAASSSGKFICWRAAVWCAVLFHKASCCLRNICCCCHLFVYFHCFLFLNSCALCTIGGMERNLLTRFIEWGSQLTAANSFSYDISGGLNYLVFCKSFLATVFPVTVWSRACWYLQRRHKIN